MAWGSDVVIFEPEPLDELYSNSVGVRFVCGVKIARKEEGRRGGEEEEKRREGG